MNANRGRQSSNTKRPNTSARKYWQYLLETIWAVGSGVMVSPLATLSQRLESPDGSQGFLFGAVRIRCDGIAAERRTHLAESPGART